MSSRALLLYVYRCLPGCGGLFLVNGSSARGRLRLRRVKVGFRYASRRLLTTGRLFTLAPVRCRGPLPLPFREMINGLLRCAGPCYVCPPYPPRRLVQEDPRSRGAGGPIGPRAASGVCARRGLDAARLDASGAGMSTGDSRLRYPATCHTPSRLTASGPNSRPFTTADVPNSRHSVPYRSLRRKKPRLRSPPPESANRFRAKQPALRTLPLPTAQTAAPTVAPPPAARLYGQYPRLQTVR